MQITINTELPTVNFGGSKGIQRVIPGDGIIKRWETLPDDKRLYDSFLVIVQEALDIVGIAVPYSLEESVERLFETLPYVYVEQLQERWNEVPMRPLYATHILAAVLTYTPYGLTETLRAHDNYDSVMHTNVHSFTKDQLLRRFCVSEEFTSKLWEQYSAVIISHLGSEATVRAKVGGTEVAMYGWTDHLTRHRIWYSSRDNERELVLQYVKLDNTRATMKVVKGHLVLMSNLTVVCIDNDEGLAELICEKYEHVLAIMTVH